MIDIIVVNYRTPDDLMAFVDSYRETRTDECELTVVDVDPLVSVGYKNIPGTLITMKENKGYAFAVNYAAASAGGDVLGIFNADIKLKPGTIKDCVTALRSRSDWGVLGPLQHDSKGLVTHGGILGTNEHPHQRGWHQRYSNEYRDIREDAVVIMGSAYFIKKKVWDELTSCPIYQECFPGAFGAFLPTFLYYEETGCSYHAAAHGYKNVYYGVAECIHEWHGSIHKHGDKAAFKDSQKVFRDFCDKHSILHD